MTLLMVDILDRLKMMDELDLLELLHIDSESIVNMYSDYIEDNLDDIMQEVDW